jgi:hypothetical protein
MPLPLIIGIAAGVAAATGIGTGIHGGVKMKEANDTMTAAKERHEANVAKFGKANLSTSKVMDSLGKKEMEILASFADFSEVWSRIHNKPDFKSLNKGDLKLSKYSPEELKDVSVGAGVLLGGLGGAAVGTAAGFAAAGATTAAVMALGTASTGTAIASLSGVAATNAALAALGGGAIAAGGGGIALGTTILGASTLGVGLLIGGVIFSISGHALSDKADKAHDQMLEVEKTINEICDYLKELKTVAKDYLDSLNKVNTRYKEWLKSLRKTTDTKTDWNDFTEDEKANAENTVLAVGLLYEMCKVKLVIVSKDEGEQNKINNKVIKGTKDKSVAFLATIATQS